MKTFKSTRVVEGSRDRTIDKSSAVDNYPLEKPTKGVKSLVTKQYSLSYLNKQLEIGTNIEMEHTTHRYVAREIALDHLSEDPEYYEKLSKSGIKGESFRNKTVGSTTSSKPTEKVRYKLVKDLYSVNSQRYSGDPLWSTNSSDYDDYGGLNLEFGSVLIRSEEQPQVGSGYEPYYLATTGEPFNFAVGELDSLVKRGFARVL